MIVWVVGAGAIGGAVAARLARAGVDLAVVGADVEHVRRLRAPGLVVGGLDDGEPVPLRACTPEAAAHELVGPCDLLLLAVRSGTTEAALAPCLDRLAPAGDVVSLQNGLNEERIAELAGPERTIGCVVGLAATWVEPGRVDLTALGDLVVGRLDGQQDERLEAARALLDRAFPTRATPDIRAELWTKLLVNAVTVLGAVGGAMTGDLLSDTRFRPVIGAVVSEGLAVAAAEQVAVPSLFGLDPAVVAQRRAGWLEDLGRTLDAVAPYAGDVKSVTWRDLELGRAVEVDAVTGELVRRGQRLGVPVPVNAAVLACLHELEAGERQPDPANLVELAVLAAGA